MSVDLGEPASSVFRVDGIRQNTQQRMSEIFNQGYFSASVCILLALVVNLFTIVSWLLAP